MSIVHYEPLILTVYVLFRHGRKCIGGTSPEIHVCARGRSGGASDCGYASVGATEAEDCALEEELLADPKERAEHIMLVDLGRNDIEVCTYDTVRVPDLMVIERYPCDAYCL